MTCFNRVYKRVNSKRIGNKDWEMITQLSDRNIYYGYTLDEAFCANWHFGSFVALTSHTLKNIEI